MRTSVSVAPPTWSVPLVVAAEACAYALDRSSVKRGPNRWDNVTGTVHSTMWSTAKPDPK